MKKGILIIALVTILINIVNAQQCLTSGGCTTSTNEYPTNGAPYTPSTSFQVLINPTTGNAALMNGGNWTRFNVTLGNKYEWTYCETYGGVSTSWDAQLTLFNNINPTTPICFSTDVCGGNGNGPYISWVATFTGVVRVLTTAFIGGVGCKSNSGTYNKLAYRQISGTACTKPGTPASATGTQTGQTSANLSWMAGSPVGSPVVTYYWAVGTSSSVSYGGSGVAAQGTTTGTTASTSALACGTVYYLSVYARTNCDGTISGSRTSSTFITGPCASPPVDGIDIHGNRIVSSWPNVSNQVQFAYIKATESNRTPISGFPKNAQTAVLSNITVGAYHFATPLFSPGYFQPTYNNHATASEEATNFVNAAQNFIGNNFLPPALDVEDQIVSFSPIVFVDPLTGVSHDNATPPNPLPSRPAMSPAALAQWIHDWTTQVYSQTGIMPVLYCTRYYAQQLYPYYLNGTITSKLWIADINHPAGNPNTTGWQNWPWVFHQYSWNGTVANGMVGDVDLDIFNGDIVAFNNLIGAPISLPSNDNCSGNFNATQISFGTTCTAINSTSSGATSSGFPMCSGNADDDVFFKFTVPTGQTNATITINPSSGYDAIFQLLTGPCGTNMQAIAPGCINNNGTGSAESQSYSGLTPGSTYFVRVWHAGTGSGSGAFSICVFGTSGCAQPSNDECQSNFNATQLSFGVACNSITSTSCGATSSGFSTCGNTNADDDVFFKFTVPTGQTNATINVNPTFSYDPVFQLLTGPCGANMQSIAQGCINDNGLGGAESHTYSGLTSGATYFIRVWHGGSGVGSGTFNICVYGTSGCAQPSNDECQGNFNATPLTFGLTCNPTTSTSCGATASGFTTCGNSNADDDVFFKFTVPANTATTTIDISPTFSYDPVFQLLTGPCGTAMQSITPGCINDNGLGAVESHTYSGLTPGATYFIRVWHAGVGVGSGTFNICVYGTQVQGCSTPAPPVTNLAGNITSTSFQITWNASNGATSYYIDVSADNFATFIPGYHNLDVGNTTSTNITGLNCGTLYSYQVRAYNNCGQSLNTPAYLVTTLPCCNPPLNDICSANVPQLPIGTVCSYTSGDISCATESYPATSCPSGLVQDVWYKFSATSNGTYTISLAPSSGMAGVLEVRQGSCTGQVLGCSNAGHGNGGIENINVSVTTGALYYVRVYEYNPPNNTTSPITTSFNICVTLACTPVIPSVSIGITAGSNPICSGQSVTFTATPDNGGNAPSFQWKVNDANVSIGTTYTTSGLINGQVVTCVMTSNAPCVNPTTASSNAIVMAINSSLEKWTGMSDNSWNNALNWSCGLVPTGSIDVIISSGTQFSCTVDKDAACKSLTVSPTAILTVQAGKKLNIFSNSSTIMLPSITTTSVTNITSNTATSGGNILNDGGSIITDRGICYGTTSNPTTSENTVSSGIGVGSFTSNLTGLLPNTAYYLRTYAISSFGTAYGNEVSFTTSSVSFTIGQSYGGGVIFYIDGTGQHGLIASLADLSTSATWYNGTFADPGTSSPTDGATNTTIIILVQGNTGNYAAKICRDYTGGGFNDWFLPAKDQLYLLYPQRNIVGGFTNHDYWSSTQFQSGNAWELSFYDGTLGIFGQDATAHVRPVRAF